MDPQNLFIYGTLLLEGNAFGERIRRGCVHVSGGTIQGRLYDLGEYPGLVVDNAAGKVIGQVYLISNAALLIDIDEYEGFQQASGEPDLYKRVKALINVPNGKLQAWAYVYALSPNGYPEILPADYPLYLKNKRSPGV